MPGAPNACWKLAMPPNLTELVSGPACLSYFPHPKKDHSTHSYESIDGICASCCTIPQTFTFALHEHVYGLDLCCSKLISHLGHCSTLQLSVPGNCSSLEPVDWVKVAKGQTTNADGSVTNDATVAPYAHSRVPRKHKSKLELTFGDPLPEFSYQPRPSVTPGCVLILEEVL